MAVPRAFIGFGLLLRFRGELLGLLGPGDEARGEPPLKNGGFLGT